MQLKNFLDVGIIALNFAGEDREKRHSDLIVLILLAFGEITHFKGLNFCIVFCFECNNIIFCSAVWEKSSNPCSTTDNIAIS